MLRFNSKREARTHFNRFLKEKYIQYLIDNWIVGDSYSTVSYRIEHIKNCYTIGYKVFGIARYIGSRFDTYI